jgi:hypothetical protein
VKAAGHEDAENIGGILAGCGASNVRFFGALAVSDLSAQGNPSAKESATPGVAPAS